MPKRKKFRLPFTKKVSNIDTSHTAKPLEIVTTSKQLYRSIVNLPLYLFIDATVDEKLNSIVISGYPEQNEIESAWQELLTQYNEAMGDNESRLYFSLHKQILQREIDLQRVNLGVEILRGCYVKEIETFLNGIFFTAITLDPEDRESYYRILDTFLNRSKSITLDLDLKRMQYESIKAKNKDKESKPTREYFISIRMNLSNHAKFEVTDKISVFEFCQRVQELNKYCESLTK